MNTKLNIAGILVIAALICGAASQMTEHVRDKPNEVIVTDAYEVRSGDTLWSIADKYCPDGMDKRDYIDDIAARNHLSGAVIRKGQVIEVWSYETE